MKLSYFILTLLFVLPSSLFGSTVKSCEPGFKKCFIHPLEAKKGDKILIYSRMGNRIIAIGKVSKFNKTKIEVEIVSRKEGALISSGLTVVRSSVESNDIWTTTTPNI